MHLGVALLWLVSNHWEQGWKGLREDSQPASFKARLALAKQFHPSTSFLLSFHNTEGQGRLAKFYVSLWFLFKLKTESGVLELLYVADSGMVAETSMTFPFPSGDCNYCLRAQKLNFQSAAWGCNTFIWTSTEQLAFLSLGLWGGWAYATEYDLGDHKSSPEVFNFYCPLGEVNYYLVWLPSAVRVCLFIFMLLGGYCQQKYWRLLRALSGSNLSKWESNRLSLCLPLWVIFWECATDNVWSWEEVMAGCGGVWFRAKVAVTHEKEKGEKSWCASGP